MLTGSGTLYVSYNRGITFANSTLEKVAYLRTTANNSMAYFMTYATTNYMYVTEDAGQTFQVRTMPMVRPRSSIVLV